MNVIAGSKLGENLYFGHRCPRCSEGEAVAIGMQIFVFITALNGRAVISTSRAGH